VFRKTAAARLEVRDIKKLKIADFVPYHNEKTLDRELPRPFPGWGKKSFGTVCSVLKAQIRPRSAAPADRMRGLTAAGDSHTIRPNPLFIQKRQRLKMNPLSVFCRKCGHRLELQKT
jgi:hypothetical protein